MATGTRLMQEINDQFLSCKICFESFREPKTLTCLHTFCLDCLQQQYEQEVTSRSSRFTLYTSRSVTCPLCRKKTELPAGGVRRLPDNFLVCNLNQVLAKRTVARVPPCDICASVRGRSVDACSKCLDCTKLLCKMCVDLHLGTKVTQQHSIIDLEGEKDIVCKVHTEEMVKFYCEPCGACICVVCAFQEHKDHEVLSFSDSYAKYRGNLESLLDQCKLRAQEVSSRLSVIDKYETVVKDVRDRIRDLAISSIAKVRAKERELMKRIDDVYGGEVQAFMDSRPTLQENLDELQNTVQFTDIMLRDKSVELLLIKRDIESKMSQLLEPRLEQVPADPALYDIQFVPGEVALGKLSFGGEKNEAEDLDGDDEIGRLKKKEQSQMMMISDGSQENGQSTVKSSTTSTATSPRIGPDVITNCTQTEKSRTQETMTSSSGSMSSDSKLQYSEQRNGAAMHVGLGSDTDDSLLTNGTRSTRRTCRDRTENGVSNGQSDLSSLSSLSTDISYTMTRAQRRAEREARIERLSGARSDRAPAPDLVPSDISSASKSSISSTSSGAYIYTPGRTIRSRKIQTEISALDVQAGASNTDREFVQTILQAELVAEKMRQEREEMMSLSPRLRDRSRRVRTAEMGVMTAHEVRIVPEMMDKETTSEAIQHRDAAMQAFSESATNYTQTPVVNLESSGMCTDREGQAEKSTGTLSIDLQDKETCTAQVINESKGTWTEGVATSDRATATTAIKHQHRAIGTVPTSTGTRSCQVTPQVSAVYTNTPVITFADLECQAKPLTSSMATMPDPDILAASTERESQAANMSGTDTSADFLTPPQSLPPRIPSVTTCDRASDAFHTPTSTRSTETLSVKTISSSTETPALKVVDREMATEETKTLDQWTETYTPTMINTGVTPPRPDTLEVGVATTAILTDEQATCTDIKSFRDTQTETALVVCDGETLTDPVSHADAQTSVEISIENRQCETDTVEVADETSMTDYYNPWEAVDTTTQASQCDTAILKTKETNTAQVKRKVKEAQTLSDPSVCPECGSTDRKDPKSTDSGMNVSDLQGNKAFKDSSTMPQLQVTQDVGTMAMSCNSCNHEYQEMAIQTFQPQFYDKSSATSFDLHEHFLARALSREYHDVATSTDSLPFIGLLSEIDVDELIALPDSAPELVSASGDPAYLGERVIMVDDETSTEFPQSVETGTQTLAPLSSGGSVDGDDASLPFSGGDGDIAARNADSHETSLSGPENVNNKSPGNTTLCCNLNCPSRLDNKHLVSIGVNTVPKFTFERETSTPKEYKLGDVTIYVGKRDKGTSTLNRVRIVHGRTPGMGNKTKSVDKITMTSRVEQREIGVETEAQQVDGKITECISKLRSVSERLNSPTSTPPSKEGSGKGAGNEAFFEKSFGGAKTEIKAGGEQNPIGTTAIEGSERNRQANVKNLLEKSNAILKRKDPSPSRKPQPITTLKGKKQSALSPTERTKSPPFPGNDNALATNDVDNAALRPESDNNYSSKSLPRSFTSERRSGTVKMGSQPLSPTRVPLNRFNTAPGRIATVPAQTLLNKTGGAAGKMGRSPSPRISPNNRDNSSELGNNAASPASRPKTIENKIAPSDQASVDTAVSKPLKRHPLPSITETRTPSSCSDNSTTSLYSSGSGASKRQSTESAGGLKPSSPATSKKPLNGAQSMSSSTPNAGPKSPLATPKRVANLSIGAPSLPGKTASQSVKDAPKSPAVKRKTPTNESAKSPSPKPTSPHMKRSSAKDQTSASSTAKSTGQPATLDPNRLSTLSTASSTHSRSPSDSNLLSVSMAESSSDAGSTSSRRSSKEKIKKSPSRDKMKNSASTETIQSNASTETIDGTKPKKSGGIGFMQRFLSKKKKSSDGKKEPVAVNTKTCPPTAEAVAALATLPGPVPAGPKESYAQVPLQHPPHHYIPQIDAKPQGPVHKTSSHVYVNGRLICIQQDNVEEKKASREGKAKSSAGSILVAHKQAMFANQGGSLEKVPDPLKKSKSEQPKEEIPKDARKTDKSTKADIACAGVDAQKPNKDDKSSCKAEKGKATTEKLEGKEKEKEKFPAGTEEKDSSKSKEEKDSTKPKEEKDSSKSKDVKTKAKKSEVKSASSWIRGRGDKTSKK